MSTFLPAWQGTDGRWIGQLGPDQVVKDYELGRGAVPAGGPLPQTVWDHCRDAYGFEALYPPHAFDWPYEGVVGLLDAGLPVLISYNTGWMLDGTPTTAHAVTAYSANAERLAYFNSDRLEWQDGDDSWALEDFYYRWIYQFGEWVARERWSGWAVLFVPASQSQEYRDLCGNLGLVLPDGV